MIYPKLLYDIEINHILILLRYIGNADRMSMCRVCCNNLLGLGVIFYLFQKSNSEKKNTNLVPNCCTVCRQGYGLLLHTFPCHNITYWKKIVEFFYSLGFARVA